MSRTTQAALHCEFVLSDDCNLDVQVLDLGNFFVGPLLSNLVVCPDAVLRPVYDLQLQIAVDAKRFEN